MDYKVWVFDIGEQMPGTMESLTLAQQIQVLSNMAAELVRVLDAHTGRMTIDDALAAAAAAARVPTSFMKYGLSYAESENLVHVDDFDGVVSSKSQQLVGA